MSFLPRARWGEVPPSVQGVFARFFEARGNVPNLFRVFALRPDLMASFSAHFDAGMGPGTVDVRLKELVAVRVSRLNASDYWTASHTALARRFGATDEELAALGDPDREPLTAAEQAAIRFAETVTLRHREMGAEDIDALRVHFSPEQIVELMCVAGLFNYLNRFSLAFGLWPTRPGEGGPEDREGETSG